MSRHAIVALAVLAVLWVGLTVVQAGPPSLTGCTQQGGPGRDVMTGTSGADVLCSLGGGDYLHGGLGNDYVRAGEGDDTVVGAGGVDVLRGGPGNDSIFAVDHLAGERVKGGAGFDRCYADPGDQVTGCEQTYRGTTMAVVRGLVGTLRQSFKIIESAPTLPPPTTPPPVPTVTVTITASPTPPECTPPPASPPHHCH